MLSVIRTHIANRQLKRLTPNIPTNLHIQLLYRKNWHPAAVTQMVQAIQRQLPSAIPVASHDN
ncbi:MAG TPA: hypothetical protein DCW31_08360 [Lactobacillus sp.]|nr:hypothetical protein [Lactobacillus sp.]